MMEEKETRKSTTVKRTTVQRKTGSRKKHAKKNQMPIPMPYVGIGVAAVILILVIVIGLKGCGGSLKTPEKAVKALITAQVENKEKTIRKCYGVQGDPSTDVQTEITSAVNYYAAHNPGSVKITECDTLFEEGDYAYVYGVFYLVLGDSQEYPCLKTFMTQKTENGYVILPAAKITTELSRKAQEAFTKFMTSNIYKNYTKEYDTFIRKNPGYEEKIAGKLPEEG